MRPARREKIFEIGEIKCAHQAQRLVERLLEFALQLFGRAEEMRVVLRDRGLSTSGRPPIIN